MSSVAVQFKQPLTKRLVATRGVYSFDYSTIRDIAIEYNGVQRDNFWLFETENDLGDAAYELDAAGEETNATNGPEVYTDMGKQVYFGLLRGESKVFTYTQVQRVDDGSTDNTDRGVRWLMTDCHPSRYLYNYMDDDNQYGQVWVVRGY